jgi:hypothetical protein
MAQKNIPANVPFDRIASPDADRRHKTVYLCAGGACAPRRYRKPRTKRKLNLNRSGPYLKAGDVRAPPGVRSRAGFAFSTLLRPLPEQQHVCELSRELFKQMQAG